MRLSVLLSIELDVIYDCFVLCKCPIGDKDGIPRGRHEYYMPNTSPGSNVTNKNKCIFIQWNRILFYDVIAEVFCR
jgi:hypothetical protein